MTRPPPRSTLFPYTPPSRPRCPLPTPLPRATRAAAGRSQAPRESSAWPAGRCRARASAGRPAPPAAVSCAAAPRVVAGSRGLDPERALVGLPELVGRGAQRRGEPVLGEIALDQPQAEVVPRPLGQHLAPHEPRRRGGPPREEPQSQAEAALLE